MAHHVDPDGKIYVDSDFISRSQRVPGTELKHMGFGEFSLETPKGRVEYDRMRGKPFDGMSGRSHLMYDDKGGTTGGPASEWLLGQMESKKLSERKASTATRVATRWRSTIAARVGDGVWAAMLRDLESGKAGHWSFDGRGLRELEKWARDQGAKGISPSSTFTKGAQINYKLPSGVSIEAVEGTFLGAFTQVDAHRGHWTGTPSLNDRAAAGDLGEAKLKMWAEHAKLVAKEADRPDQFYILLESNLEMLANILRRSGDNKTSIALQKAQSAAVEVGNLLWGQATAW